MDATLPRVIPRNACEACGGPDHGAMCILGPEGLRIDPVRSQGLRCARCGRGMYQHRRGRPSRFCSVECRRAWWGDDRGEQAAGP